MGVMGHCVHGKMSLGVKNKISCKKPFDNMMTTFFSHTAVAGLFEDSGTAETMAALLSNPDARNQWNALYSLLSELLKLQAK